MCILLFSVAITAHIAQKYGEKEQYSFTEFARQSLFLATVGGEMLCIASLYFCKPILLMAGAKPEYLYQATQYAIPALSAPAIILHGILAGIGDTKTVLTANVFGNVINILCNAILIYGIGPFPKLGVFCKIKASQILHKIISTHPLIMEVDFCPVLCIPEVPVLQAFRGISHFVWYCKAVSDLS